MQWSKYFLLLGGFVFLGVLAAYSMGMRSMMRGSQEVPRRFQSNGERIYFTGTNVSGQPIPFTGGDMHIQMHGGGCATCHGVDRRGGARTMMRWFTVVAPPLTPEALFGEHDAEGGGHGDHQAYTTESLRRAITEGIDPAENRLDDAMPRWSMSEQDLADLIKYLQGTREEERHSDRVPESHQKPQEKHSP